MDVDKRHKAMNMLLFKCGRSMPGRLTSFYSDLKALGGSLLFECWWLSGQPDTVGLEQEDITEW